jgi:RNA polymerase sigma-70 factor (ECF subfamily)
VAGDDSELLASLRAGDEAAFARIVTDWSRSMIAVARGFVSTEASAEEVVQETWLAVIKGLGRFEGRSSLKTWIFRILVNSASTRGQRESRILPFSSLPGGDDSETTIDGDRFFPPDHRFPGGWYLAPTAWETPEDGLLSGETREVILEAIEELPPSQRAVVTLRDVEGWPSDEVCDALELSEGNQRVLLHRGRSKIRLALERYLGAVEENTLAGV